jgi:hypothetical protein
MGMPCENALVLQERLGRPGCQRILSVFEMTNSQPKGMTVVGQFKL